MRPCQAAPALETDDVDTAEGRGHGIERRAHRGRVGHVADDGQRRRSDCLCLFARGGEIDVEEGNFGAGRGERLRGRGADGAAGAGDGGDLARERRLLAGAELGLFERPIFAIEHVGFGDRLEAADRFGVADAFDPGLGNVSGNLGIALGAAEAEQAEPRHQHDAGQRIELMFDMADAGIVLLEIVVIARGELVRRVVRDAGEFGKFSGIGRRQHQRPVLGADGVVRGHHAGLAQAGQILGIDEIEHRIGGAEFEHQPAPGAFACFVFFAAGAAHDRRDLRHVGGAAPRRRRCRLAAAGDKFLGARDHFDHALIGFARALAEGDDAVFGENEAVARFRPLENIDRLLGQAETRHDVRHEGEPAAENFRAFLFAVGLIDDAEHGGGVGVIDEFVRQERVQHDLDRRIGRRRIDQARALDADELVVANLAERAQLAQRRKPNRRQPGEIDHRHVGAGRLDAQNLDVVAEAVAHHFFQRGVAAAVQDELGVAAEQPRRVDTQRQVAIDARFRAFGDDGLGVTVDPAAFHGALPAIGPRCFYQPPAKRRDHHPVLRG